MGVDELDRSRVLAQLAEIGNASLSGNHRGRTLENLLVHVFQSVPGIALVESRCLNDFGTEELDLIFWNDQLDTGLRFIDTPIFVECKAWSGTVSGREIDHFVSMLRRKGARYGFFVALNGISGQEQSGSCAHFHVVAAHLDGVRLIILTGADLAALTDGQSLIRLIKEKVISAVVRQVIS